MRLLTEFVIKGTPSTRTAQQKGCRVVAGHVVFFEKPEVRKENEALYWKLYPFVPETPYTGKLCVRLLWAFDKKSLSKTENRTFNNTRPDLDNLAKGTLDVMAKAGLIAEDAEISKLDLTKVWCREYAGLFVQIWEMNDEQDFETYFLGWRDRIT